jgi:glyoxylase-like metal-dependent hydrolase (beta-lactamase superfamily II)
MDRPPEAFELKLFETSKGALIFQIPLLAFPGLWGFAYLVFVDSGSDSYRVLIDSGSGFGESNQQIEKGFYEITTRYSRPIHFNDLTHILITHGHIDHFGGLTWLRPQTHALLGVHELDLRNLTNYEERLTFVSYRLLSYLIEAGFPEDRSQELIEVYQITKRMIRSVNVDFTYEAVGMQVGPFEMLHTPGHCPGQVVIRLHDVLFSGDQVLHDISPHQSPEQLTLSTGLDHYLKSLTLLRSWAKDVRITLAGHQKPIGDLDSRINAIITLHKERLEIILDFLREPHTIKEVADHLFGEVHGYNVLLAIEEAGAHVEYLERRGLLSIENLKEFENNAGPISIYYRHLPSKEIKQPHPLRLL